MIGGDPRLEPKRGSGEEGSPRSAEGEGAETRATRAALPRPPGRISGRRPRSHAAVEPAARPSSGPKARAVRAIFTPSPPPDPGPMRRRTGLPRPPAASPVHTWYRRPRSSRRETCWGGAGTGTWRRRWVSAGTLTGSANRPQLRRRILHRHTHSQRAPLQRPPLLARLHSRPPTPSPPTWAPRRDLQRFFPARSLGVRLRTRAAGVRAAASVSFIGFLSYLPLCPQPALSFFKALFSRLFLPCVAFPSPSAAP